MEQPRIPRAELPGISLPISRLGLVVEPPTFGGPAAEGAVVVRLRRARAAGVNIFDVAGATDPVRSERIVAAAFPERRGELVLIVPAPRSGSDVGPRSAAGERRAGFRCLFELSGEGSAGTVAVGEGPFVRHLDGGEERLPPSVPGLYVGPYSLVDQRLRRRFEPEPEEKGARLLVRDPFAGGRLDGSRFASVLPGPGRPEPPPSVRALQESFAPVLRVAFLARDRRRTLPQAAVQYLFAHPWVATVLAPLPPVERLEELLDAGSAAPLSVEELRTAEALESADPAGRGSGPRRALK